MSDKETHLSVIGRKLAGVGAHPRVSGTCLDHLSVLNVVDNLEAC